MRRPERFSVGDEQFVVVSRSTRPAIPDALSKAEAGVFRLMVAGRSKPEIAALRETSVGTVANQIRSIYDKLEVTSQNELLAKVRWSDSRETKF